jgi:hypothetical protein
LTSIYNTQVTAVLQSNSPGSTVDTNGQFPTPPQGKIFRKPKKSTKEVLFEKKNEVFKMCDIDLICSYLVGSSTQCPVVREPVIYSEGLNDGGTHATANHWSEYVL